MDLNTILNPTSDFDAYQRIATTVDLGPVHASIQPLAMSETVQDVGQATLLSKSRLCPPHLHTVMPAWHSTAPGFIPTWKEQLLQLEHPAPGSQTTYYAADTTGHNWGTVVTVTCNEVGEVNYIGHLYFPNILHEDVNYDVVSFVAERTPPMPVVYDNLGIPTEQHGLDLNSIVPDRRKGGEPQCALSTLLQILLISSPRKCLLGYELLAMLKGHFRYFRSLGTTKDWQFSVFHILRKQSCFQAVPAPVRVQSPAEQVWYINYSMGKPQKVRVGGYMWRTSAV